MKYISKDKKILDEINALKFQAAGWVRSDSPHSHSFSGSLNKKEVEQEKRKFFKSIVPEVIKRDFIPYKREIPKQLYKALSLSWDAHNASIPGGTNFPKDEWIKYIWGLMNIEYD